MEREQKIVRLAKTGNYAAFEQLIEAYEKKIYNIALRMCKNEQDALDVSQEVFLRIFRSIGSFKEESAFSTWVYRIAFNLCIDYGRKQKKHTDIASLNLYDSEGEEYHLPIADFSADPQLVLEDKELQRAYHAALNKLSEDQKQVVLMRDVNGFTYQEISELLGCSLGTVKSKLNRARNKLRSLFQY